MSKRVIHISAISECIAMLSEDSSATIDSDFPKDVEGGVASHRHLIRPHGTIGVTALELGYGVATSNLRHFKLVPGLSVSQF
jgi:hypothetical protein